MSVVLKLLNATLLGEGWFSAPAVNKSKPKTALRVTGINLKCHRSQLSRPATGAPWISQCLFEEERITSLSYENKLYKRLPNESMPEFHRRVLAEH